MSNWTQTEDNHELARGTLGGIIFYSDRSWSRIVVFGQTAVFNAAKQTTVMGTPIASHKKKSDLPEAIPATVGYLVDGTEYGLAEGKQVLLVSGLERAGTTE